jgi:hypothetical protein
LEISTAALGAPPFSPVNHEGFPARTSAPDKRIPPREIRIFFVSATPGYLIAQDIHREGRIFTDGGAKIILGWSLTD